MRGPGFRRDLDVRRVWRCPECGVERRLSGEHTSLRCHCRPEGVWMRIAGERNAVPRAVSVMSAPEIPVADFQLTEEELAKPLEGRVRRRPFPRTGPDAPPPNDRRPENRPPDHRNDPAPDAPQVVEESAPPDGEGTQEPRPNHKPRRERKRRNPESLGDQMPPPADAAAESPGSLPEPALEPAADQPADAEDGFAAGLE